MAERPRPSDDLQELLGESGADELWLVSYADLLTLLLGFFLLVIAGSAARPARFEQMAASLSGAQPAPLAELKTAVDGFIERAALEGRVVTRQDADGLGIELKDALLFDSGSARIRPEGARVVDEVAQLLQRFPERTLVVEGHTDDVPIHTPVFASNWELASQRALNVLHALERGGVARERLSARSFADTRRPLSQGTVEQQRLASRRVVIRVE